MPGGGRPRAVEEAEEEAAAQRHKTGAVRTFVAEGGLRDAKGRFIGKGQKKASEGGTNNSAAISSQDSDSIEDRSQDGRSRVARKRRAASPDPYTAALIAQLTAEDAAALKRTRRVRPLDLDKPMPVLYEGTEDEAFIKELLSLPGAPTVEDPDSIRTTADFLRMLEGNPDTAFIAAPGMVLTEFNDVPAPAAAAAAGASSSSTAPAAGQVITPAFSELNGKEGVVRFERPEELIMGRRPPLGEGKEYDATPEDLDFLDGLKKRNGGEPVLGVDDLEVLFEELERDHFCGKEKAGVVRDEARLRDEDEALHGRVKDLVGGVKRLLSHGEGFEEEIVEEEAADMEGSGDEGASRRKPGPKGSRRRRSESSASGSVDSDEEQEEEGDEEDVEYNKDERYLHMLRGLLEGMLTCKGGRRRKGREGVDVDELAATILGHWRKRRAEDGCLVRAYQAFPLMPNWGQSSSAAIPDMPLDERSKELSQQAYERLLSMRYELDKARILVDVLRRREKLKREWIRTAVEASERQRPEGDTTILRHTYEGPQGPPLIASFLDSREGNDWGLEKLAKATGVETRDEVEEEEEEEEEEEPKRGSRVRKKTAKAKGMEEEEMQHRRKGGARKNKAGRQLHPEEEKETEEEAGTDNEDEDEEEEGDEVVVLVVRRKKQKKDGQAVKGEESGQAQKPRKKVGRPRKVVVDEQAAKEVLEKLGVQPPGKMQKKTKADPGPSMGQLKQEGEAAGGGGGGAEALMAPPPKKRGRPRKIRPKEEEGGEEEGAPPTGGAGPEDEVETLAILAGQGRVTVLTGRASAGRIWTEEEDRLLLSGVRKHGFGKWLAIRKSTGLDRNASQMNQRHNRLMRKLASHRETVQHLQHAASSEAGRHDTRMRPLGTGAAGSDDGEEGGGMMGGSASGAASSAATAPAAGPSSPPPAPPVAGSPSGRAGSGSARKKKAMGIERMNL